jgi:hypothetical protein
MSTLRRRKLWWQMCPPTYLCKWVSIICKEVENVSGYCGGKDNWWLRRATRDVFKMWLCKNISYIPIWVIYFLPTSAVKLTLGLQIGGRLLIRNYLDQSLWSTNQKTRSSNTQIIVIALFSGRWYALLCLSLVRASVAKCTKLSKVYKNAGTKPFCWAKSTCFDFSSSNF